MLESYIGWELNPDKGACHPPGSFYRIMSNLNLELHALQAFGFLISEYGYRCTEQAAHRVPFESPVVHVDVVYDGSRSHEVDLDVRRVGLEPREHASYSIGEILRLCAAPDAKEFDLFRASSEEQLVSYLEKIAQALKAYGKDFLLGDVDRFTELVRQRRRESEVYALERELRMARRKARAAWDAGDYAGVVSAFGLVRHALTPADADKLKLAEDQLRRGG